MRIYKITPILVVSFLIHFNAFSEESKTPVQNSNDRDSKTITEVNSVLDKDDAPEEAAPAEKVNKAITRRAYKKLNVTDYSQMLPKSEYEKFGVVQTKELAKASRVQLKGGVSIRENDAFYSSNGLMLGLSFHFNETWGIGATGQQFGVERNGQARNIFDIQGFTVDAQPTLKTATDVSLYFTPFYGKWSFLNDRVLNYEIYFAAGAAQVKNQFDISEPATSVAIGHMIALSRNAAVDINLQGLFYNSTNVLAQSQKAHSVMLNINYSYFLPQWSEKR